jgi:DNA invertase Pin-like site-specific DNA recombinase
MSIKFVNYFRISAEKQGMAGYGIQAQKYALARYLKTLDCELTGNFHEMESKADPAHPQLRAAIRFAKSENAVLVINKLDRLARNAAFLTTLLDSGCDFICCDMANADPSSLGILALLAQQEREASGQRAKAALAEARQREAGLADPWHKASLKKAQSAIQARKRAFTEHAMAVIKELQGTGVLSFTKLAAGLNQRGEKAPRGTEWTATTVRRVMLDAAKFAK